MTSFLLYYVSGNSERMIFNKNIISNNDQAPFLIPGHEEKCLVVLGCCGFASRMQHAYPKSPILRAFTVAKEIGFTIKSVLWRFRKVCYTSEFRFRGVFLYNRKLHFLLYKKASGRMRTAAFNDDVASDRRRR